MRVAAESTEANRAGERRRARLPVAVGLRGGGIAAAAVLAAIGILFAWQSSLLDLGDFALPGPGFFPLVLGLALAGLGVVIGIECWLRRDGGSIELGHRDVLIVFVAMLAVAPLFEPLGALPTLGLFGAVLLCLIARTRVAVAAVAALAAMAACWYFFQVLLGLQLPAGPLS
jgi:hypothetical protein